MEDNTVISGYFQEYSLVLSIKKEQERIKRWKRISYSVAAVSGVGVLFCLGDVVPGLIFETEYDSHMKFMSFMTAFNGGGMYLSL